ELIEYHLDSTETAHDPIEALKEAQRAASQVVTDITLVMERVQARLESCPADFGNYRALFIWAAPAWKSGAGWEAFFGGNSSHSTMPTTSSGSPATPLREHTRSTQARSRAPSTFNGSRWKWRNNQKR